MDGQSQSFLVWSTFWSKVTILRTADENRRSTAHPPPLKDFTAGPSFTHEASPAIRRLRLQFIHIPAFRPVRVSRPVSNDVLPPPTSASTSSITLNLMIPSSHIPRIILHPSSASRIPAFNPHHRSTKRVRQDERRKPLSKTTYSRLYPFKLWNTPNHRSPQVLKINSATIPNTKKKKKKTN